MTKSVKIFHDTQRFEPSSIFVNEIRTSVLNLNFSSDSYPISYPQVFVIVLFYSTGNLLSSTSWKNKVAVPNGSFTSLGCEALVICIAKFIAIAS